MSKDQPTANMDTLSARLMFCVPPSPLSYRPVLCAKARRAATCNSPPSHRSSHSRVRAQSDFILVPPWLSGGGAGAPQGNVIITCRLASAGSSAPTVSGEAATGGSFTYQTGCRCSHHLFFFGMKSFLSSPLSVFTHQRHVG